MRISADAARCEGHGMCENVAPAVYQLDDDAMVVIAHDEVPPELERSAEAGARACPLAALQVIVGQKS